MIWAGVIDESCWLVAADTLRQIAMEKCVLDVELVHRPSTRRSQMENCSDGCRFDHRRERLVEIDTGTLRKTPHNPLGFASFQ